MLGKGQKGRDKKGKGKKGGGVPLSIYVKEKNDVTKH